MEPESSEYSVGEGKPKTVEEAVRSLIDTMEPDKAIEYLREHKGDVTEFSLQVFEVYQQDPKVKYEKAGIIQLSIMLEKLLDSSKDSDR